MSTNSKVPGRHELFYPKTILKRCLSSSEFGVVLFFFILFSALRSMDEGESIMYTFLSLIVSDPPHWQMELGYSILDIMYWVGKDFYFFAM